MNGSQDILITKHITTVDTDQYMNTLFFLWKNNMTVIYFFGI